MIWDQIDKSIASVYLAREQDFSALLSRYKYKRNFFEMVRFDFIVDENFKVHLLEVNSKPESYATWKSCNQRQIFLQQLRFWCWHLHDF
jgi:Tubulin-tyrosine ligase family